MRSAAHLPVQDDPSRIDKSPDREPSWTALVAGCIVPLICWSGVLVLVVCFFFTFEPLDFDQ